MLNATFYQGRLTKEIELKETGNGQYVTSFTLAVENSFKKADGTKDTNFINCVAWRKTAEALANYVKKGDGVIVTGQTQVRNYENKEGNRVYVTECVVKEFDFPLQNKRTNESSSEKSYKTNDPFEKNGSPVDIDDDSLPF